MPINRTKVLPDNVHFWRGKRWNYIAKKEAREGDALRIIRLLGASINAVKKLAASNSLNEKRLRRHAQEIILLSAQLADEKIRREREENLPVEDWNEAYVSCLRHHWSKMPKSLRREIVELSSERARP